jgi:hypothetical protein
VIATSTPVHAHSHAHAPIPESAFLNAEEQDAANEDGDSDDEYDLHGLGHAARRNAPAGALEPSAHMRQSRRRDRLANFVPRFFAPPVEPAPPPPYAGGVASASANGNGNASAVPMSMPMPMFVSPPGTGAPGAPNVAVAGVAPGVHISEAEMPTRPMPTLPTPFREEPPCYDVAAPLSPPLETSILGLGHGAGPGSIGSVGSLGSLGSLGSIGSGGAAPAMGTFETLSVPPPAFDAAVTTGPPLRLVMPPTRVRGRSGAGTGTTPVVVGATPMATASNASNNTA